MKVGGIILAGGQSSRMGEPKAWLPFGPEVMLQRITRLLGEVVGPIAVVAAPGQVLPPLPADVRLAIDGRPGRGPLEGMSAGMGALEGQVAAAYITSCDVPLLNAQFVQAVIDRLLDADIALPWEGKFGHPLAAVYRLGIRPQIEDLLSADQLRPAYLFERVATVRIPLAELQMVDPDLATLDNLNTPAEYTQALCKAGFNRS